MKVCHVIETLGRGGAEQLLATILPSLKSDGVDVAVMVLKPPLDLAPQLERHGIQVIQLKKRNRWNLPGLAREIAKVTREHQFDIVHAHLYFPSLGTALARVMRQMRAKTCVSFHNLAYAGANKDSQKLRLRRALAKWMYPRGIDQFFGVSTAVAQHYGKALALPNVDVLYNPVDTHALLDLGHPIMDRAPDAMQIVLPGRLVHEKGHKDLIDAMALLKQRGFTPNLTFLGDGPRRSAILAQIRSADLDAQITLLGAMAHEDLLTHVAAADLVCIPSHYEGFGLTALEAMALGRPVIASTAGGLPEVLGTAGQLVPVGDVSNLAHTIQAVLSDTDRRRSLGAAAALRAQSEFGLPQITKRLITFYNRLLGA